MRKLPVGVLLVLCVLARPGLAQRGEAARVLSADGVWHQAAQAQLARGHSVTRGDELLAEKPGGLLLDCGGSGWIAYTCKQGGCRVAACTLEGTGVNGERVELRQSELVGGLVTSVSDFLFKREPRQPRIAAARSGGNPTDAVVLVDSRGLHIGPSLARVLEGQYCLTLTPLPEGSPTSLALRWDRDVDPEGLVPAAGLVEGLYRLEKGMGAFAACAPEPDAPPAWVLVVRPQDYERINSAWRSHLATIAGLERNDASVSTVSTARHAILAALAEVAGTR